MKREVYTKNHNNIKETRERKMSSNILLVKSREEDLQGKMNKRKKNCIHKNKQKKLHINMNKKKFPVSLTKELQKGLIIQYKYEQ